MTKSVGSMYGKCDTCGAVKMWAYVFLVRRDNVVLV